ncbi:hypothetical protein LXL04_019510 [Taraxacum kok-saghyz]
MVLEPAFRTPWLNTSLFILIKLSALRGERSAIWYGFGIKSQLEPLGARLSGHCYGDVKEIFRERDDGVVVGEGVNGGGVVALRTGAESPCSALKIGSEFQMLLDRIVVPEIKTGIRFKETVMKSNLIKIPRISFFDHLPEAQAPKHHRHRHLRRRRMAVPVVVVVVMQRAWFEQTLAYRARVSAHLVVVSCRHAVKPWRQVVVIVNNLAFDSDNRNHLIYHIFNIIISSIIDRKTITATARRTAVRVQIPAEHLLLVKNRNPRGAFFSPAAVPSPSPPPPTTARLRSATTAAQHPSPTETAAVAGHNAASKPTKGTQVWCLEALVRCAVLTPPLAVLNSLGSFPPGVSRWRPDRFYQTGLSPSTMAGGCRKLRSPVLSKSWIVVMFRRHSKQSENAEVVTTIISWRVATTATCKTSLSSPYLSTSASKF